MELRTKYDILYKKTSKSYFDNIINKLLSSKPSQAYSLIKKLGARPGDIDESSSFSLPNHTELNLSSQQSADQIAEYFSKVSQDYEAITISRLPSRVQDILSESVITVQLCTEDARLTDTSKVWDNI